MNEFLEWARKNARSLAVGAAGLLALSVLIGFLIGRAQRGEHQRVLPLEDRPRSVGMKGELQPDERAGANSRLLPPPIATSFDERESSFSFVLDGADATIADMEPVPLKISDLLENKAADVQPDVKPFVFNNEEFDVLVTTNELAEP